jgi:hypothetical protein
MMDPFLGEFQENIERLPGKWSALCSALYLDITSLYVTMFISTSAA